MNPDEAQSMRDRIAKLEAQLDFFIRATTYEFKRTIKGDPNGLRIGDKASDKLGFMGKTPIAQWSSGTGRQDVVDNTGSAANVGFRATGNTGSTGYSLGDVVAFLKTIGLFAP